MCVKLPRCMHFSFTQLGTAAAVVQDGGKVSGQYTNEHFYQLLEEWPSKRA